MNLETILCISIVLIVAIVAFICGIHCGVRYFAYEETLSDEEWDATAPIPYIIAHSNPDTES